MCIRDSGRAARTYTYCRYKVVKILNVGKNSRRLWRRRAKLSNVLPAQTLSTQINFAMHAIISSHVAAFMYTVNHYDLKRLAKLPGDALVDFRRNSET